MSAVAVFCVLSYVMFVPATFVMLIVALTVVSDNLLLMSLQLPVDPVTQLLVPPGLKLALTVALATAAVVLLSKIATVAAAFQPVFVLVDAATIDLTATTCLGTATGVPLNSE